MTLSPPSLRRFVRRALVDATAAGPPDPAQLASAFDLLCERLRRQLQPLFGTRAVNALFVRALHVAIAEFSWLRDIVRNDQDPCVSDRIASVGQLEIDTLEEGLAAVLAHNIGLLNALVGEDLVLPLVQQAWGVVDAPRTEDEP
jgi:hypothetical protein